MIQRELENYCLDLYERTNKLWSDSKGKYPDWKYGYNVLYGPPRIGVDLFFVSYQGAGDDKTVRMKWPPKQFYAVDNYKLGNTLKRIFRQIGKFHLIEESSGSAVIFFNSPSASNWKENPSDLRRILEKFSIEELGKLIAYMKPKIIIAIGNDTFSKLSNDKQNPIMGSWCNIVRYGSFQSSFVLGVPHLSGARIRSEDMATVVREIDRIINEITSA